MLVWWKLQMPDERLFILLLDLEELVEPGWWLLFWLLMETRLAPGQMDPLDILSLDSLLLL